mgnify:CR=1 FL=1
MYIKLTNKQVLRNKDFFEIIFPDNGGSEISLSQLLTALFLQPYDAGSDEKTK